MMKADAPISTDSFAKQALRFARDFAGFAGARGVGGVALAGLGAAFEGIGLLLLVPLISIVTASEDNPDWIKKSIAHILDAAGVETRTGRLTLLLALFAALIVVRALVVARRDATLIQLQMGFVEDARSRVAASSPRRRGRSYRGRSMRG